MSTEKHSKLVDLLLKRTREGALDWRPSVDDDRYQVSFRDNTVRLYIVEDRESGNPMIYVELINDQGIVAETINDEELDRNAPKGDHHWYGQLSLLFQMARRTALGSDKILDEILSELEDDPFKM